jgi:predicted PhzF superfamily epimerase YddE/YHI9
MRPVHVLRVFTDADGNAGNPLGVVSDMSGLHEERMQPIATELGFSETVFIDWMSGGVPNVRIFTPSTELPFAGHPLVGTAWYLNEMGPGVPGVNTASGYIEFDTSAELTWIKAPVALATVAAATDGTEVSTANGWPQPASAHDVMMPRRYLLLDLGPGAAIGSISAVADAIPMGAGEGMVYPYQRVGGLLRCRAFVHAMGIPEDPATGSAAAAYAMMRTSEGEMSGEIRVLQGPDDSVSEIELRWDGSAIHLGGRVLKDRTLEVD